MVKIHYSQQYGYCFFVFLNKLQTLTPFKNMISYNFQSHLAIITFDLKEGFIYEFSEHFMTLLKFANQRSFHNVNPIALRDKLINDKLIRIQDLLVDFDFGSY